MSSGDYAAAGQDGQFKDKDPINPQHYKQHPSGIECIRITEHMSFCLGNAVKYIWRADLKGSAMEDLEKAKWYLQCEIDKRKRNANKATLAGGTTFIGKENYSGPGVFEQIERQRSPRYSESG